MSFKLTRRPRLIVLILCLICVKIVTVAAVDGRIALSEALDEDEDLLLLFSNGREWFQLYNNLS